MTALSDLITGIPNEMFGTKWPSMMSMCNMSTADSIWRISAPSRAKSAARIEGAIRAGLITSGRVAVSVLVAEDRQRSKTAMNMPSVELRWGAISNPSPHIFPGRPSGGWASMSATTSIVSAGVTVHTE